MREMLFLLLALAGIMALCAADAVDQQQNGAESPVAEAQHANRPVSESEAAKAAPLLP
jgi:hypothetical protein